MSRGAMLFLMTGTAVVLLAGGCSTVTEVGTALGTATGTITPEQAASINRGAQAMERSFKDITPEQEHYIGRSVAATVMGSYKPYDEEAANRYLNVLGQILAQASDRPETFGGYHFQLLDSDEINAFAAPGGLIMVTRGMVRCCKSEDALSAVLAHEIGHVQGNHGLRAIRSSRLTDAFTILAVESAKNLAGQNVAELTKAFEGSIGDVTSTLMNSGYSRGLERDADRAAVIITARVGYDPQALIAMLKEMKLHLKPGGIDFAKTHPDPADRIADLEKGMPAQRPASAPAERQERFRKAMSGV